MVHSYVVPCTALQEWAAAFMRMVMSSWEAMSCIRVRTMLMIHQCIARGPLVQQRMLGQVQVPLRVAAVEMQLNMHSCGFIQWQNADM